MGRLQGSGFLHGNRTIMNEKLKIEHDCVLASYPVMPRRYRRIDMHNLRTGNSIQCRADAYCLSHAERTATIQEKPRVLGVGIVIIHH